MSSEIVYWTDLNKTGYYCDVNEQIHACRDLKDNKFLELAVTSHGKLRTLYWPVRDRSESIPILINGKVYVFRK